MDDTTLAEYVDKNGTSSMESCVDEFVTKSRADGFQLNESKCKELRISFNKSENPLEHIMISNDLKCYYEEIFIFFFQPFSQKWKIQMQTKGNYHESRPT